MVLCTVPPTCGQNQFRCKNGNIACVHIAWICDGQDECSDGSEELDCPECKEDEFQCENKQCVAKRDECDGISLCIDGSDSCGK